MSRTMTHHRPDRLSTPDTSSDRATDLIVSAAVDITDRHGVQVSADSLDAALDLIRQRQHRTNATLALSQAMTNDPHFTQGRWRVTPTGVEPTTATGPADYHLTYTRFTVIVPGEGSVPVKTQTLDAITTAAQSLARIRQHSVRLTSELIGFTATTISPPPEQPADPTLEVDVQATDDSPASQQRSIKAQLSQLLSRTTSALRERRRRLRSYRHATLRRLNSTRRHPTRRRRTPPARTWTLPAALRRPRLSISRRSLAVAAAATVIVMLVLSLTLLPQLHRAPDEPSIYTAVPQVTETSTDVLAPFGHETWTLDPERSARLGWYKAGVAYLDPETSDLILLDHTTGDRIATAPTAGHPEYTVEFMFGNDPAVGVRTPDTFTAITAAGHTQTWNLAESDRLRITGTTPLLTTANGDIAALLIDNPEPVPMTPNPRYRPAAIDGTTLIQVATSSPAYVTIPHDGTAAEHTLPTPAEDAEFDSHLSIGHGKALTSWKINGTTLLAVYDIATKPRLTAVLPTHADPGAWAIGRGMQLAIVGPHAIDLATGTPAASLTTGTFSTALGQAAVTDTESHRLFVIGTTSYTESRRVIGYDGTTALVRNPNGSVTAMTTTPEGDS